MKKFLPLILLLIALFSAGCLAGQSDRSPTLADPLPTTVIATQTPGPKPVIQAGSTGERLYSINSDKTNDRLDLYECADMAVTEWYAVEENQKTATFMVGNLRRMPQNLTDIEDVWILTTDSGGRPVAIVPRDHAEILQYESQRVFENGARLARPAVFHNFMSLMIEFRDKVRKYNEWMAENLILLGPSGSANLDESMKTKWTEKYQKEKEIDEIVDLLNHQLGAAAFAVYPPFGSSPSPEPAQKTIIITTPVPTRTAIITATAAVTTTAPSPTTAKPFISAAVKSSTIKRGGLLEIGGVAEGGAQYVYINIFSMDGTTFPTKVYTAPVQADGWYELTLDTNAFPAGLYGVTLELPTGDFAKLTFMVE